MNAERCTIYIIEMVTDKICSMFGTGIQKKQIQPPRKGSIAGKVISSGKSMINNDLERHQGYHTLMDTKTGFVTRSMICVPLVIDDESYGAIQIVNKKHGVDGQFDTNDCETEAPSTCGNETQEGQEICDGRDLDSASCTDFGFSGGTLVCNESCNGYDTNLCTQSSSNICGNNSK